MVSWHKLDNGKRALLMLEVEGLLGKAYGLALEATEGRAPRDNYLKALNTLREDSERRTAGFARLALLEDRTSGPEGPEE